ncbi:hypothetical protein J7382_19160 [Shimia sp. R11_0]|uniref:hypothetical protein n=1 Tax=Shimia sp. R11_0 TaxID=2821096 RepID=UPI001ADCBF2C|nr:hypothetical protein [Shimia sp. R11_0]MBO9479670.1 hypothetical protein [Shimia sp. R11_0]
MDGAADEADRSTAQSAASAAVSAAARSLANRAAMQTAALSDGTRLRDEGVDAHFTAPLWSDDAPVSDLLAGWETFQKSPDPHGIWTFWIKWYRGMFAGSPMDWSLQLQVALIADAIWEDGPEAVAAAIRDIQTDKTGPAPLEEKLLRKHVEYLLRNPTLTEATALNGADAIERAIADYLREAPANCLPEDLKHLEALPQHFKAIARVIGNQVGNTEKENRLVDEISKLHARVAELEKELAVAKSKERKGVVSQNAAASLGKTIGSLPFWGVLATGTCYFFGVTPSDLSLENLRDYLAELSRANSEATTPSIPTLPSSTDV